MLTFRRGLILSLMVLACERPYADLPGASTTGESASGGSSGSSDSVCGNSVVEAGEECDDGNKSDNDACVADCKFATCGDGFLLDGSAEECDDGGLYKGDGCDSICKHEYIMFVTSAVYGANFSGVAGADTACADAAKDKLPGTYVAWISSDADLAPKDLPAGKALVRRDGETIAMDSGDLVKEGPLVPINFDENGVMLQVGYAWTGTTALGTACGYTCMDWASAESELACVGNVSIALEKSWTADPTPEMQADCSQQNHLYCFRTL